MALNGLTEGKSTADIFLSILWNFQYLFFNSFGRMILLHSNLAILLIRSLHCLLKLINCYFSVLKVMEKVKFREKSDAKNAQKQCNVNSANFKHVFLQNIFKSNSTDEISVESSNRETRALLWILHCFI